MLLPITIDVAPFSKALANVKASNFSLFLQASANPTKNSAINTPELPLAPSIAASDIIFVKSSTRTCICSIETSKMELIVKDIFVPVSPSGTGKTLILFKWSCLEIKYLIPAITALFNRMPSIYSIFFEDDILNNGLKGGENALNFLGSLMTMLQSNTRSSMNVTVKWDGAPAIFAGTNPDNGKFFVGTKSIFNKTPKINYTNADIDANHGGGLAEKLKVALKYFPALGIPGIWQGDLLYTSGDLKGANMDGQRMIVFTPNTITYAVPVQSNLARRILGSKIGVVWHTTYSGKSMEDLSANFGANVNKLNS